MDGVEMPRLGQGTWPIIDQNECVEMVIAGLYIGYRHVNTAQMYDNEAHVDKTIERSVVLWEELFEQHVSNPDNPAWGWQLTHE